MVIYRIAVLRVHALDEGAVVLQFVDADVAADPRHVVVRRDLVQRAPAALFDALFGGAAVLPVWSLSLGPGTRRSLASGASGAILWT